MLLLLLLPLLLLLLLLLLFFLLLLLLLLLLVVGSVAIVVAAVLVVVVVAVVAAIVHCDCYLQAARRRAQRIAALLRVLTAEAPGGWFADAWPGGHQLPGLCERPLLCSGCREAAGQDGR